LARRGGQDLAVGAMFTLGLLVVALAVMAVGGDSAMFFRKSDYTVAFPTADGLLMGAPVKMSGVTIGTVTDIRLPKDPALSGIRVRISIDPDYAPRVRDDSRAALRILQLLTNEKFVEILPGTTGAVLEPGTEIPREIETGVFERGQLIAEDLTEITASLKSILTGIEQGKGLLGQIVQDPEFGKKGLDALGRTLENTERLTADLMNGKGTIGRLLYDESVAGALDDFAASIAAFASLMDGLGGEDSVVQELLAEGGTVQLAAEDLRRAAAALSRVAGQLENDRGLLGRLLNDPEYSEELAQDLRAILDNMAQITHKINTGDGTLGALVNERVLYDGAEEVMAGVNDSKFARWMLRHYQKKGIKAEDQPTENQEP
jgi:phospholipid/cholesterol/gamma-HCH transport system substrate-binding protein